MPRGSRIKRCGGGVMAGIQKSRKSVMRVSYSLVFIVTRCLACLISIREGRGLDRWRRQKLSIEALAVITC